MFFSYCRLSELNGPMFIKVYSPVYLKMTFLESSTLITSGEKIVISVQKRFAVNILVLNLKNKREKKRNDSFQAISVLQKYLRTSSYAIVSNVVFIGVRVKLRN